MQRKDISKQMMTAYKKKDMARYRYYHDRRHYRIQMNNQLNWLKNVLNTTLGMDFNINKRQE